MNAASMQYQTGLGGASGVVFSAMPIITKHERSRRNKKFG
jgi:hypothetical protein